MGRGGEHRGRSQLRFGPSPAPHCFIFTKDPCRRGVSTSQTCGKSLGFTKFDFRAAVVQGGCESRVGHWAPGEPFWVPLRRCFCCGTLETSLSHIPRHWGGLGAALPVRTSVSPSVTGHPQAKLSLFDFFVKGFGVSFCPGHSRCWSLGQSCAKAVPPG